MELQEFWEVIWGEVSLFKVTKLESTRDLPSIQQMFIAHQLCMVPTMLHDTGEEPLSQSWS